ncbi:nucleoside hydrolase [Limnoraphis robusta Tam1]|uniref:nucleoside hydrolase n=1 Tax=Limnoraphis robusta TaxID=1118279 RepID=UPI002B2073B8|nr:nucleoside hydrolase [Limnoraphis robusta]MEA5542428.1 nucleoside hydrolase [Limnoraphis robusta Tam1]
MNPQISPPKIILDTDPGGDDAFALLWLISLVKQGFAELLAVTSVEGNVNAKLTFTNACKLLQLTDFPQIEVGRGIIKTQKEIADAAHIHGNDGLGNLAQTLPSPQKSYEKARYSDEIIIEKLTAFPGEITIVALAPLTNLASAETQFPGILKQAKEIIIMGGAFNVVGNVTPEAEFNIAYSLEASEIVLNSSNNLVILPLDVTRSLIFLPEMAENIAEVNPESPISQFILALAKAMTQTSLSYRETQGISGFLVHDAVTLAYLFYPETLQFRRGRVEVEVFGKWTKGKTICDRRHHAKMGANAWVAQQVNSADLLAAFVEDLKSLVEY